MIRHDPLCICRRCLTPPGVVTRDLAPRKPAKPKNLSTYELGVRTFDEIAAELGTTRQNVHQAYRSAIRKLRARPVAMRTLLAVAEALNAERSARASAGQSGHRVCATRPYRVDFRPSMIPPL